MSMSDQIKAVYEDLNKLPENKYGEIIEGEVHVFPRPNYRHGNIEFALSLELGSLYRQGRGGGPGGWIFLVEPEVMLGENLLVPDLAGWKQERLPAPPTDNWTTVPPDWVCEILSPRTFRIDRVRKMPIYAAYGIPYLWLIAPFAKVLETYKLKEDVWTVMGNYAEKDKVRVEPFQEVEIDLANLWWGD